MAQPDSTTPDQPTEPVEATPFVSLLTEEEIDAQMARIDGINGAAGHHISDPEARKILRRQISGEITGDEARALLLQRIGVTR